MAIVRIMPRCLVAVFTLGYIYGPCQASFVNSHLPVATSVRHHDVLHHHEHPKQNVALSRLQLKISDEKDDSSSATMCDSNRRNFLTTLVSTSATFGIILSPGRAAAYSNEDGSANLKLPNYIEFLIEKNKLVDEDSILYKGPNSQVQLQRLADAAVRLDAIPALAADKKWSQVQGILTGPLGTVLQTMTQVTSSSSNKTAQKAAKASLNTFKSDLLAIGEAASKRTVDPCIEATEKASLDLEAFIKLTF